MCVDYFVIICNISFSFQISKSWARADKQQKIQT